MVILPLFDSPFLPPGHLYLLPPSSLYNSVNLSRCSGLWRALRDVITALTALSPSYSPFCLSVHIYFPPPPSLPYMTL